MAYIDVLPLATAKAHLGVDDTASDAEITSLIQATLKYIEDHTNIMVYDRDKEYVVRNGEVRLYDYPINSVVKGIDDDDVDVTLTYKTNYYKVRKGNYTLYYDIDVQAVIFVANVGYATASDVSEDLINAALDMIWVQFYRPDEDTNFRELISPTTKMFLDKNRRFLV